MTTRRKKTDPASPAQSPSPINQMVEETLTGVEAALKGVQPASPTIDSTQEKAHTDQIVAQIQEELKTQPSEVVKATPLEDILPTAQPEPVLALHISPEKRPVVADSVPRVAKRKAIVIMAQSGAGKSQPLDEPVLTPTGFVPMGTLQVGDYVVGSDGLPTEVTGVFPQGQREVYKVTFEDGTDVRCDREHLWAVSTPKTRSNDSPFLVKTTEELLDSIRESNYKGNKFHVPRLKPLAGGLVELSSPYSLGYFLGNGSAGNVVQFTCCSEDVEEITSRVALELFKPMNLRRVAATRTAHFFYSWADVSPELQAHRGGKEPHRINVHQLTASSRLELLQGLMDSDGSVDSKGNVRFSSYSCSMADLVVELVRALGGFARIHTQRRSRLGKDFAEYTVAVKALQFNPFQLSRKAEKFNPVRRQTSYAEGIVSIERDGEAECQCISVAAEDNLYATAGYKLTHNTTSILPTLTSALGWPYFGTGDLFKALMTGMHVAPVSTLVAPGVLKDMVEGGHFEAYLRRYEYHKEFNIVPGDQIIKFIETLRCIVPNLPALSVAAIAEALDLPVVITDAINFKEAQYLDEALDVGTFAIFDCDHPRPKAGTNNRQTSFGSEYEAKFGERVVRVRYHSPEESISAAKELLGKIDYLTRQVV